MRAQQVNRLKALTMAGDIRGAYEKAVQLEPGNRTARFALFNFYFVAPGIAGGGLDKARVFAEQTQAVDLRVSVHREHRFRIIVNTHSGIVNAENGIVNSRFGIVNT
jgi:hypothetical protein